MRGVSTVVARFLPRLAVRQSAPGLWPVHLPRAVQHHRGGLAERRVQCGVAGSRTLAPLIPFPGWLRIGVSPAQPLRRVTNVEVPDSRNRRCLPQDGPHRWHDVPARSVRLARTSNFAASTETLQDMNLGMSRNAGISVRVKLNANVQPPVPAPWPQSLPDVTFSVAAGNHPRVGTGAAGLLRQIRAFRSVAGHRIPAPRLHRHPSRAGM